VRSIGRFEAPLEYVGRGAGGEVLSGRLRLPGGGGEVRVALKAAPLTSSGAKRMEHEARVLDGVPHHPHVCHPLTHFRERAEPVIAHLPAFMQTSLRDETLSVIVMPRLERTMHGLLAIPVQGPKAPSSAGAGWRAPAWLTPDVMLGLWLQLLSAIAHLEHHGVAHCDLHLGNIMAGSDGTLFVIDFGCSARRGADGNWDIVVRSEDWVPGKKFTLAPEVRLKKTLVELTPDGEHIIKVRITLGGQPAWEAAQAMFCMSTGRAWADADAVRLLSQGEWRVEGDVLSAMGAAAQRVLVAMLHENSAHRMSANHGLAALVEAAGGWDRAGDLVLDTRAACRVALGLESATAAAATPNLRAALASASAHAEFESARRVRQVLDSQLHSSSQLVVRNLLGKGCNGMVLQCDVDVPGRAWLVSPRGAPLSFVVKVLYPMGMVSSEAARQVGEEFSLVSALSHPNVIRVHRHLHGEAPDSIIQLLDPALHQFAYERDTAGHNIRKRTMQFVVMDRHAETLQAAWQRFTQAGRVPVAFADVQLMLMAWQVVSAFAYLDSKGIEHRDIKLDRRGRSDRHRGRL
jgi:serine/threonine protein kinase